LPHGKHWRAPAVCEANHSFILINSKTAAKQQKKFLNSLILDKKLNQELKNRGSAVIKSKFKR
jgi:hypothetical protein